MRSGSREGRRLDTNHNIMKPVDPPEIAADPTTTAIVPPEPEPNSVSDKVGQGWVPRPFIADNGS